MKTHAKKAIYSLVTGSDGLDGYEDLHHRGDGHGNHGEILDDDCNIVIREAEEDELDDDDEGGVESRGGMNHRVMYLDPSLEVQVFDGTEQTDN